MSVATDGVSLSRQTVSQHLAVLENAGLIEIEWNGRTKVHSLSFSEDDIAVASWLTHYTSEGTKT